jgi:hypothetical protein
MSCKFNANDDYRTPDALVEAVAKELGIQFCSKDPCPMGSETDGLSCEWGEQGEWVFCNPPFSKTELFVKKAIREHKERGVNVVMILSARTENFTWQDHIFEQASKIYFIRTGFRFCNPDGSITRGRAPQGLALVLFCDRKFDRQVDTWNWRKHGLSKANTR